MKHYMTATSVATAFFLIFFSSVTFGQGSPCTAHLIQTHFKDSLGYESQQQALLGETFSLMSLEIVVDTFEGVEVSIVNDALVCYDDLRPIYSKLFPHIDLNLLRESGIENPFLDSLAVEYDLLQHLTECRLINVELNAVLLDKIVEVQEERRDELLYEKNTLVRETADLHKDLQSAWKRIEFLIQVMEEGKPKCMKLVAKKLSGEELTDKQFKRLKRRFNLCQCFARKN